MSAQGKVGPHLFGPVHGPRVQSGGQHFSGPGGVKLGNVFDAQGTFSLLARAQGKVEITLYFCLVHNSCEGFPF